MNAPSTSTLRINTTPRGDRNPRGPAIAGVVVGWMLVLVSLGAVSWARFQPSDLTWCKVALAVVVLVAMAVGVAMAGGRAR